MPKLIAALALQSEPAMKAKSNIVDVNVVVDLSRQYKTMQVELTSKVERLEKEVSKLKEELGMNTSNYKACSYMNKDIRVMTCLCVFFCLALCQEELRKERRQHEQLEKDKDATVADLQHKLDNMDADYEKILHVSCTTRHVFFSTSTTSCQSQTSSHADRGFKGWVHNFSSVS